MAPIEDLVERLEGHSVADLRELAEALYYEPSKSVAKPRKWTDSTGAFSVVAKFRSLAAGAVKLKKKDGSVIAVSLDELSDEDKRYVKKQFC